MLIDQTRPDAIKQAIQILRSGGVISFATETVYALAADAGNDQAIAKLYEIKKRHHQKAIAIMVKNLTAAKKILQFNDIETLIAKKFMPGPITLVLKVKPVAHKKISKLLNSGKPVLPDLGLRIPDNKFALELLREFNGIIAATSANISGEPDIIDAKMLTKNFNNKIDLIIDGGICEHKIPSTVLKIDDTNITIIRAGSVSEQQIKSQVNQ